MARIPDFPFFGAGDATYFEWAVVQVLFARDPSPKEKKAITAVVPPPLRDSITWNRRYLGVASGQVVHVDIARTWPEKAKRKPADEDDEEGGSFIASDSQVDLFNAAIERWLEETHAHCPILAAYRDEDLESGGTQLSGWHRWSLKQFPGLWKPLKAFPRNEASRAVLEAIAAVASRARFRVPEEFIPPKKVNVLAPASKRKKKGKLTSRDAVTLLVERLGMGARFDAEIEEERGSDPEADWASQGLADAVVDASLAGSRARAVKELATLCRTSPMFAAQLAYHAFQCFKSRMADALDFFEILVKTPGLSLDVYNNAVGALSVTGKTVATPQREQRFIKAALPYGKKNPSIYANVACVSLLRGRPEEALDYLELSVKHGHDRALILKDRVFRPLRLHPRWIALVK